MFWLSALLAVVLGALLAFQVGVNARLRHHVGDPAIAGLISAAVAALALLVFLFASRRSWPDPAEVIKAPWWVWTGGIIGGLYISLTLPLVTRLGAALLLALLVVGQMLAALVLDHFGALNLPQHAVNPWRILGVAFLVVGVVLIRRF
jgi:transporter family-2 protein